MVYWYFKTISNRAKEFAILNMLTANGQNNMTIDKSFVGKSVKALKNGVGNEISLDGTLVPFNFLVGDFLGYFQMEDYPKGVQLRTFISKKGKVYVVNQSDTQISNSIF